MKKHYFLVLTNQTIYYLSHLQPRKNLITYTIYLLEAEKKQLQPMKLFKD